jgi:hypothetical protein
MSVGKTPEHSINGDQNGDSAGVFSRWLVFRGVPGAGVGDRFGVTGHGRSAFEGYPVRPIDLRHGCSQPSVGVDDLLGGVGANDAQDTRLGVVGVPDGNNVW